MTMLRLFFTKVDSLFVIVLEFLEELENLNHSQLYSLLHNHTRCDRPLIIQATAPNGYNAVFVKGYKDRTFHDFSSEDLPADVAALKEMLETYGRFDGHILDSKMAKIVEKSEALEKIASKVLCLRVLNLFEGGCSRIMPWLDADWVLSLNHLNAYFAFIDYPFEVDPAVEKAWGLKNYSLLATFIQRDSRFPEDFNMDQMLPHVNDDFKKALNLRRDLHRYIADKRIIEIFGVLKEMKKLGISKHLKRCHNELNEGVLVTCLRNFNAVIYELLLHENFKTCSKFWEVMRKLPKETKKTMAEIHAKFFTPIPQFQAGSDEHPLMTKCWLSICHSSRSEYSKKIDNFLKRLEKTPETKQLLELAMTCRDLKIIFDLKNGHAEVIDPSWITESGVNSLQGNFNPDTMVIALSIRPLEYHAKGLFCFDTVPGAFARLLTGLAMQMLYKNNCSPFESGNEKKRQHFGDVIAECREKVESSGIFNRTRIQRKIIDLFHYRKYDELEKALISLIPEFLIDTVDSWDPSNDIEDFKSKFAKLLDYYAKYIVPDIDSALKKNQ